MRTGDENDVGNHVLVVTAELGISRPSLDWEPPPFHIFAN